MGINSDPSFFQSPGVDGATKHSEVNPKHISFAPNSSFSKLKQKEQAGVTKKSVLIMPLINSHNQSLNGTLLGASPSKST